MILAADAEPGAQPGQTSVQDRHAPVVAKLGDAEAPHPVVAGVELDRAHWADAGLGDAALRGNVGHLAGRARLAANADAALDRQVFVDRDVVTERRRHRDEEGSRLAAEHGEPGDQRRAPRLDRLRLGVAGIR